MSVSASGKNENASRIRDMLNALLQKEVVVSEDLAAIHGFELPPGTSLGDTVTLETLLVQQLVIKACAGNDKSITEVLDRLMGKPAQVNENFNANLSYTDFLKQIEGTEDPPPCLPPYRDEAGETEQDILEEMGLL